MAKTHLARIDTDKDHEGRHRWRLIAANGKVIADSGYSYRSELHAMRAADTMIATAKSFPDDSEWVI